MPSVRSETPGFVYEQRVRAQDCAESGRLGHPRCFEYLEAAMIEAFRKQVEPLAQLFASGRRLTVAETSLRFFEPANFDDLLNIEVTATALGAHSFILEYLVRRNETLLAVGQSCYVCLDARTGLSAKLPEEVRERLRLGLGEREPDLVPVDALRRFYAEQHSYYSGGPIEPLGERLTEDVVWHVPGDSPIAGTHRGKPEVCAYFAKRRELSAGSFRVHPEKILLSDDLLVQSASGEAELGGREVSWETLGVFRLRGSRVAECWLVPFDQAQFDRLWS